MNRNEVSEIALKTDTDSSYVIKPQRSRVEQTFPEDLSWRKFALLLRKQLSVPKKIQVSSKIYRGICFIRCANILQFH